LDEGPWQKQIPPGNDDKGGEDLKGELAALAGMGYSDPVAEREQGRANEAGLRREYHRARVLLGQGRAAEAVPLLERLERGDPEKGVMGLYLAHAYRAAGRMADCRALCERLLTGSPDWVAAPLLRAQLAIAEGDAAKAQREMQAQGESGAIGAAWGAAVWAEIGERLLEIGDRVGAEAAFAAAKKLDIGLAPAHEGLARVLLAEGRAQEAAEAALDAVRLKYEFAAAHRTLSEALTVLGRTEAAEEALKRSSQLAARVAGPTPPARTRDEWGTEGYESVWS
jgi:tetratricopeptide (TPR) repeat protein